ncbi:MULTISPECIES: type II toxin-antitoxin system HipA family toxin [Colwellia]|uniref:Phosphatidylinositol kinase n=1 Tax=Colwellia marinimaniae TaxID=1513592 RepID=A0ABQ0MUD8_9GAMM|nr:MULTISPECIES: HipA domain-containing protein [Colwellia]GAW95982.1 phosphatidylinositol kinase [Colwellia marinimaniae]
MISKAFVFIDGLEDKPIVCGVVTLDTKKQYGEFRYGQSYLGRKDAFALDPLNLPLNNSIFNTTNQKGVFGVLLDAGADSWGKKVILSLHNTKPKNSLEFLLAGAGMGVGSLVFSLSSKASKFKVNKNTLGDIPMLLKAKDSILKDDTIPKEAKKAFEYGSSMGGARPKTTVSDGDISYLAKFNRSDDLFNHAKVEHAAMNMLNELTACRVATTKVLATDNGDVLLVERFDLLADRPTHHFISANSLINVKSINPSSLADRYSYGFLAEFILKNSSVPEDAYELFQRMVFNVLIGNTDDHTRNHAFLYSFESKDWRLSPAYDVLPINSNSQHSLGIGLDGRNGTIENLLSQTERFGLKRFKAEQIIKESLALVSQWPTYFKQHGVGDGDIERLKAVMPLHLYT